MEAAPKVQIEIGSVVERINDHRRFGAKQLSGAGAIIKRRSPKPDRLSRIVTDKTHNGRRPVGLKSADARPIIVPTRADDRRQPRGPLGFDVPTRSLRIVS